VEMSGDAVDDATGGHADPQRAAAMPATQIAPGAAGQRGQRRALRAARGRRLHRVQRPAEPGGGHDARRPGARVDAERPGRLAGGLPMAPETARSARSRRIPASSNAVTCRFTVAMLSWVTWAMTSRAIGPRRRAAPNTDAAAASATISEGATTRCRAWG